MLSRRGLRRRLARFGRDARGVSATEFALVAPFLILMLLGVSDFAPSLVARFKAAHANNSFGDLIAQVSALQTTDLAADYAAAAEVMAPYDATALKLRVTSVYSDGKGHAYVNWSCGPSALPPLAAKAQVTVTPTGTPVDQVLYLYALPGGGFVLNGANTSYVTTESLYTYTAPAQFVLSGPQTMTSVSILYPRQSAYVGFPWNGDANTPPPKPTTTTKAASMTLGNGVRCNYQA